jgi:hypothetical protein
VDFVTDQSFAASADGTAGPSLSTLIGTVEAVAGSAVRCRLDPPALATLRASADPALAYAAGVGTQVKIASGALHLLCSVRDLEAADGSYRATVDVLGEGRAEGDRLADFRRGATRLPMPGDKVHAVGRADLARAFSAEGRPHIEIGTVHPTEDVRAALFVDPMLSKHFALLGSTGTGKSTSTALILHRIVEQAREGHIVMLDPHGEYAAAFAGQGLLLDVDNLQLPYWLMNFEEHCEVLITTEGSDRQTDADILAKCLLAARSKSRVAQTLGKLTVDSPVPYLLSDLMAAIVGQMGKLDKADGTAPYLRLKTKLEELTSDPRYAFMFSGMLVSDTMADFLARTFRLPAEGKPIAIVDLSGVPSDIVSVVVAVLSRLVFDYAVWSRREPSRPILLVCEEAHRYVPSDRDTGGVAVRKSIERIAKEGRKYGVALGLVTQRPSDLAEGVLSQCGTMISLRLNNDRDQAYVRNAMPEGARGFLDALPSLRNRECIIVGEGVPVPMRVRLDDLAPHLRPASDDPVFTDAWREVGDEAGILDRTIFRWRGQGK